MLSALRHRAAELGDQATSVQARTYREALDQVDDGGLTATKPYAAGGAYINRMSDYCGGCRYRPAERVGEHICSFNGGYWWFLDRNAKYLADNRRMNQPLAGLRRLRNLDDVVEQQKRLRGHAP